MVKGSGQRKSETALAPSREAGEAIAKNSVAQSPNVRRNCPWTDAEHRLFLLGLEEYGRGNWRDIAARYVSTRTPTQVASHAQKYFLREGLPASRREKRRPSIHDIRSATEAPIMTAEERVTLRSSLQIINRESMDSIDTRAVEGMGRGGFRHSVGAAYGRNYSRNHTRETGSSGEVSTGAVDRNAYSSRRESIGEEELYLGPQWQQSHPESSEGFPELPEEEEAKRPTLPPGRADWQASALFGPTTYAPHEKSTSSARHDGDVAASVPRRSFEPMPSAGANMLLFGTSLGGVLPEQAAMHAMVSDPGSVPQQNPLTAQMLPGQAPLLNNARVGFPTEFPAAYPIRHSFGDEPAASVYDDSLPLDVPSGGPDRYAWTAGAFGYGGHGQQSVGRHSGATHSSAYGSDCDQLTTCPIGRTHSDVAPMPMQVQQNPSAMNHQNPFLVPHGMPVAPFDRSNSHLRGAGMALFGGNSLPMVYPTANQPYPQENYGHSVQHTARVSQEPLFGSTPAGVSYVPSIDDFRRLELSSGPGREELLMHTGEEEDPLLTSMHDLDQDML